ncbi:MAG: hypothetical protein QM504_16030 [Pseudomonadota bacterium]
MRVKLKSLLIILLAVFGISHISHAELLWSPKPDKIKTLTKSPITSTGHQHGQSKEKAFYLKDNKNARVKYINPALKIVELNAQEHTNKYIVPKSGMDNYHALVAERSTDTLHESSLRYFSMRGKPSGTSPENLIKQHKLPLEIIPQPMIREHWRFYTQNKHMFQIFFDNKPVVDTWVILKTSNGTTLDAKTDSNGNVAFILPDDFKNIKAGRRANKPQEFMLRTTYTSNNITYKTNFTAPYSVNPSHWKSNAGGLLALSVGFISGLVIMRRHNKNNKQINKKNSGSKS